MTWKIKWQNKARKDLRKLSPITQKRVLRYLRERIVDTGNPRLFGKELKGDKTGLWRYRIGDYRIICEIRDEVVTLIVIRVGHRKNIYAGV